ncbi:cystathionine beta-lyase [Klebsiella pneumoniae]|uniref:cystathionine beta-lyase n=1 Tax=Klebsiella pneumoniae TaxID=573 RepID=UPI001EECEFF5|nr:cystathionine beta-lyase [Klebsiella pneumoniae]HBY8153636.1 cystathionine beta-lyase [Klebsiella pneumoniae]
MTNHSFDNQMSPETYLCHGPFDPEVFGGVVNPPVYHASTVIFKNCKELNERHQALFEDAEDEVMYYGRFGTPITFAVQKALAELEGGYRSLLVPTGLAACTSALLALVKSGDHILVSSSVYGPTRGFVNNVLAKMGVSATFFDPTIGDGIGQLFQENTTVVFTESPGSQTFDIQDIPAITRVAHAHNAKVIIDNTWATPLFFKPFEHGVDVSVHAATKYIVGHSDAQMGLITTNKETWLAIRRFIYLFGLHAAPDDVYLAQRGLRTMSLRLGRHQDSALKIAKWFEEREEVEQVLHPALPSCPGHEIWKRDFTGSSGLFSVVLKPHYSKESVEKFIDSLQYLGIGFSWGGFESLAIPFNPRKDRPEYHWPYEGHSFRLQIGLEDPVDLVRDLDQALRHLKG